MMKSWFWLGIHLGRCFWWSILLKISFQKRSLSCIWSLLCSMLRDYQRGIIIYEILPMILQQWKISHQKQRKSWFGAQRMIQSCLIIIVCVFNCRLLVLSWKCLKTRGILIRLSFLSWSKKLRKNRGKTRFPFFIWIRLGLRADWAVLGELFTLGWDSNWFLAVLTVKLPWQSGFFLIEGPISQWALLSLFVGVFSWCLRSWKSPQIVFGEYGGSAFYQRFQKADKLDIRLIVLE